MTYRGFILKADINMPNIIRVVTEGKGGRIPNLLSGMFSSRTEAIKRIDLYLEGKGKKSD